MREEPDVVNFLSLSEKDFLIPQTRSSDQLTSRAQFLMRYFVLVLHKAGRKMTSLLRAREEESVLKRTG